MKIKQQFAALPFIRRGKHIEVLLITRRRSGRWIIPKGWPEAAMTGPCVAALEAYEEAGLKGQIGEKQIGCFRYLKQLTNGQKVQCNVSVFPLLVTAQYLDWPEKGQRQQRWVKQKKVEGLIEEADLLALIQAFKPPKEKNQESKTRKKKRSHIKAKLKKTGSSQKALSRKKHKKSRKSQRKAGFRSVL